MDTQMSSYKCMSFPSDSINEPVQNLFNHLKNNLNPMEKQGPMSGRCEIQTNQMEMFLHNYFHFNNIPGEYIVHGVKSFTVDRLQSLLTIDDNLQVKFPSEDYPNPFVMSIAEIREWQRSFVVYADEADRLSIDKNFIKKALQGQSEEGDEAFRMKFVIRISTCPVLMEFDGQIIQRNLTDQWPHKIKLVSVTGVDFAGRIHDIKDILTYITNWRQVYVIDPVKDQPFVYNGRDFATNRGVPAQLDEERLYKDLIRMARLRLSACDKEKIEIVVETGIGLGVFAGRQIGIDDKTRSLSAKAVKHVLEKDGSTYAHIRAVIFAMPIFEIDESTSTYRRFVDTFNDKYSGSIPVMIADQDMHRLTVAIARQGFIVSELNPADSHGVFGEYWQNRGPAVEEKLALTTVGLFVQHHLFNEEHVLNPDNYKYIRMDSEQSPHTIVSLPTNNSTTLEHSQTLFERLEWIPQWIIWLIFSLFLKRR